MRKGVLKTRSIVSAFLQVERAHFVLSALQDVASQDQPIYQAPVHLSAPNIYALVLEILEIHNKGHQRRKKP